MRTIDIHSTGEHPANVLSNFYPHRFVMDGVECACMEGFLQSLKFKNPKKQKQVCAMAGRDAKAAGSKKRLWKITGNIYWNGKKYARLTAPYTQLLRRAYKELYTQSSEFNQAIKDTQDCILTHARGKSDPQTTILTDWEFLNCLMYLRKLD